MPSKKPRVAPRKPSKSEKAIAGGLVVPGRSCKKDCPGDAYHGHSAWTADICSCPLSTRSMGKEHVEGCAYRKPRVSLAVVFAWSIAAATYLYALDREPASTLSLTWSVVRWFFYGLAAGTLFILGAWCARRTVGKWLR